MGIVVMVGLLLLQHPVIAAFKLVLGCYTSTATDGTIVLLLLLLDAPEAQAAWWIDIDITQQPCCCCKAADLYRRCSRQTRLRHVWYVSRIVHGKVVHINVAASLAVKSAGGSAAVDLGTALAACQCTS